MKTKILGLMAVGLLTGPMAANAVQVTLGANTYTVTTTVGTFDDLYGAFTAQPWWGDVGLAVSAVSQVNTALGLPNDVIGIPWGPIAAFAGTLGSSFDTRVWYAGSFNTVGSYSCSGPGCGSMSYSWLIVETAVPEPGTLALLGLGLAGLGLSRRRKAA